MHKSAGQMRHEAMSSLLRLLPALVCRRDEARDMASVSLLAEASVMAAVLLTSTLARKRRPDASTLVRRGLQAGEAGM